VADSGNDRVSLFRVEDGTFVRHVATGLSLPMDVEEWGGGWVVACGASRTLELVDGCGVVQARLGQLGRVSGEFSMPTALALARGVGLAVRCGYRVQVFTTPDAIAMASVSAPRLGWMVGVARALLAAAGASAP
jgi:hypothetical protein